MVALLDDKNAVCVDVPQVELLGRCRVDEASGGVEDAGDAVVSGCDVACLDVMDGGEDGSRLLLRDDGARSDVSGVGELVTEFAANAKPNGAAKFVYPASLATTEGCVSSM